MGGGGYLGQARGEDHNLKDLAYSLHECVHSRSLQDVDLMHLILHLDGNDEVGIVDWLKEDMQRRPNKNEQD